MPARVPEHLKEEYQSEKQLVSPVSHTVNKWSKPLGEQNIDARVYNTAYLTLLRMVERKVFGEGYDMAHLSSNDNSMEVESYVYHFLFHERSTWNHHRFLNSEACL
jgi:hypothetical protein